MARICLTGNLTIYVNASSGSDSSGDGSSACPFQTLQFAHDYVQRNYDLCSHRVTYIGTGNFTAGIVEYGPLVGQCSPTSQVFTFTPNSSVDGGDAIAFWSSYGLGYMIDSVTIKAPGPNGVGVTASSGSTIALNTGIIFGSCGFSAIQTAWSGNVYVNNSLTDTVPISGQIISDSYDIFADSDIILGALVYGYPLNGAIDECGVWTRALTSLEVESLYNGGNGKPFNTF